MNQRLSFARLPESELSDIVSSSESEFQSLRDHRILILGGTGFVGKWLTSALLHANQQLGINIEITIVSRDSVKAEKILDCKNLKNIKIISHDFSNKSLKLPHEFEIVFHGATPSVPATGGNDSIGLTRASKNATTSIIENAIDHENIPRVINLSSGAVFNIQPMTTSFADEIQDYNTRATAYGLAKIATELELQKSKNTGILKHTNARLFAFFGPHLSLEDHFAIGNFLRDATLGHPIRIKGNPQTRRSYMYPTNLVECLIKIIPHYDLEYLNVGSDAGIEMMDLARRINKIFSLEDIQIMNSEIEPSNYVPNIQSLRRLGIVDNLIGLEEGILKWSRWLKNTSLLGQS